MTNEEFIDRCNMLTRSPQFIEHAKKLVALSEAANAVYSSAVNTQAYVWEVDDEEMQWLGHALKELQGGDG